MKKHNNIGILSKTSKVSNLSPDELKYICKKINIESLKQYLKKKNNILPGFRADKMPDDKLIDHIISHIKNTTVANLLEIPIDDWLNKIQEKVTELKKEGASAGEALIKAIRDSKFHDNCKLYFKLSELSNDDKYIELFSDAISYIKKIENIKNTESETKEDQSKLLEDIENLNSQKKAYAESNERLEEELKKAQLELEHYKHLEKYADTGMKQDDNHQFQYISIGKIIRIENTLWIERLADVENNEIRPFVFDKSRPYYFNNRNRIHREDGPDNIGAISIWKWNSIPVNSDKDKTDSEHDKNTRFIEVVELHQCRSLDDLSKELSQGVDKTFISDKVLFVYTKDNGFREGLLCLPKSLEYYGGKAKISKSIVNLPHYILNATDTVNIAGIQICRKVNLGIPRSLHCVRKPYDVIREKVLARTSYLKDSTNSISRTEIQKYKNYINKIPMKSLVQDIMDAYECSEEQAQKYVDGFIKNVELYLDASDFDTNVLSFALEKNTKLVERCKEQLSKEWREENDKKISEEMKALHDIKQNKNNLEKEVTALKDEKNKLSSKIEEIKRNITEREKLASDVEKQISKRIDDAKQNAADFISQMAFIPNISTKIAIDSQDKKHFPIFMNKASSEFKEDIIEDLDDFEDKLRENFNILGYADKNATDMAFAISFCFCNRIPIIIRENSMEISRSVATLINNGSLYEVFVPIDGISLEQLMDGIQNVKTDQAKVFLIHGIFDGYNLNLFNALVNILKKQNEDIFVFLSIEGLSVKMLPADVWNRTFYIDGDDGLINLTKGKIHSFNVSVDYKYDIDSKDFKIKKATLNAFSKIIGCMHTNLYAMYLSCFKVELNNCDVILNQLIANACSSDNEELLKSLFQENGVSRGEELLSKML